MSREEQGTETYRMWGGRFAGSLDPRLARFTASLAVDLRLLPFDLRGSLAHARMLADTGIIPAEIGRQITAALVGMLAEADAGAFPVTADVEDVHTLIEAELTRRIGEAAGWLHTARSRNDQVATAFRLWVKDACLTLARGVTALQDALLQRLDREGHLLLPAYTHLQRAQPVVLGHYLLAHVAMLRRDVDRLRRALAAADVLPLGSGAAVGVSYPVDRQAVARMLGFAEVSDNSLDATGDRDFALEFTGALAQLGIHLSRWAAEVVLWSTEEFGFVVLTDAISTGSSIMPQKRNPDPAELIRGRVARLIADHGALHEVLRGLPLGYHRDLQEDKALVFSAADTARDALEAAAIVAVEMRFRPDRMRAALEAGYPTATEISDVLVARGVPFRQAHHLAGQVVRYAEGRGKRLTDLAPEEWSALIPGLDEPGIARLQEAVTPEGAVQAKDVLGGTAPRQVAAAAARAAEAVRRARAWIEEAQAEERRIREALRAPA